MRCAEHRRVARRFEDQNSGKRIWNHLAVDESFHHPLFGGHDST